jgi:hypothetical protein
LSQDFLSAQASGRRVARWPVFKPKIPIWLVLEGLTMENLGIFYDHLVYFTSIGNILWPFCIFCGKSGIFFPVLVFWTKKNLATLPGRGDERKVIRDQGDQMGFSKNRPKCGQTHFSVKFSAQLAPWKTVAQYFFALLL